MNIGYVAALDLVHGQKSLRVYTTPIYARA